MHKENRYREPHEFVNDWKDPKPNQAGIDALKKLRKEVEEESDDLIHELEEKVEQLEGKIEDIEDLKEQNQQLNRQIDNLTSRFHELEAVARIYQEAGQKLSSMMLEYGDHQSSCNIIEALSVGRLLDIDERDMCTCGWTDTRLQLQSSIERGKNNQFSEEEVKQLIDKYR